jgi:hypothetical protein
VPLLAILLIGGGAFAGYAVSNSVNSTVSLGEGLLFGAVLGVGAAAVYYAYRKV